MNGVMRARRSARVRRSMSPAPTRRRGSRGSARLRVADRVHDRVDRVLEAVAVGRDDPRVGRPAGAARPRGSSRARRAAGARSRIASASGPSGSSPRSSVRRRARSSTEASRKILRSASGRTTVPMSRPAMTIPPPSASARWRSRSAARSSGIGRHGRHGRVDRRAVDVVGVVGAVDEDAGQPAGRRPAPARPRRRGRARACGYDADTSRASASQVTAR